MDNDVENLSPKSNREWFQQITRDIKSLQEDRTDDRDTLADFIKEFKEWQKEHDKSEKEFQEKTAKYFEKVDNLETASKKWDISNTLLAAMAAIGAAIGLFFNK